MALLSSHLAYRSPKSDFIDSNARSQPETPASGRDTRKFVSPYLGTARSYNFLKSGEIGRPRLDSTRNGLSVTGSDLTFHTPLPNVTDRLPIRAALSDSVIAGPLADFPAKSTT